MNNINSVQVEKSNNKFIENTKRAGKLVGKVVLWPFTATFSLLKKITSVFFNIFNCCQKPNKKKPKAIDPSRVTNPIQNQNIPPAPAAPTVSPAPIVAEPVDITSAIAGFKGFRKSAKPVHPDADVAATLKKAMDDRRKGIAGEEKPSTTDQR